MRVSKECKIDQRVHWLSRSFYTLFLACSMAAASDGQSPENASFVLINVEPTLPVTTIIAVHACAGLYNGKQGGSAYLNVTEKDQDWLDELQLVPKQTIAAPDFLNTCMQEIGKSVKYKYSTQQSLLPNILTVGSVLEAVPLDERMVVDFGQVVFDATVEFSSHTPRSATEYVYNKFVDNTTGLALLDPGYCTHRCKWVIPQIDGDMKPSLLDYVFSSKLFAIYLPYGCMPWSTENALLNKIAKNNPWTKPIAVYGYNNLWKMFGGFLHEAMTYCVPASNMGAVPTEVINLSFFSTRRTPITTQGEIQQISTTETFFNPNKTYVTFLVGDGDNIAYLLGRRMNWRRDRIADCEKADNSCATLTWTISPHINRIAPDVLKWYLEMAQKTGKDYFMLPCNGYLYAYPGALAKELQDTYVLYTEQAADLLGTHSTIHWEWFHAWSYAENVFLPKYATKNGTIRGIFPMNVPYMFPSLTWKSGQFFKIIQGRDGGRAVLFRPMEWRGVVNDGGFLSFLSGDFFLRPDQRADQIEAFPRGTVAAYYMTSDGGLNLTNAFMELVKLLPDHVELVNVDTAAKLALDAWDWRKNGSPTCNDGVMNGDEQGVDCGGPICQSCSTEVEIFACSDDGDDCLGSLMTIGDYDTELAPDGNGGGGPHHAICDVNGTAITSVEGYTGSYFDQISGDCSSINIQVVGGGGDSLQTVMTPNGGTPMIGIAGNQMFKASCEPNEVVVGFDVWDHKPHIFAPNVVDSLELICREVRWDGQNVEFGDEVKRGTIGNGGNGPYHLRCGDGRVAKGIFLKTGQWVDSIGLKCANLQFVAS